MTALAEEAAYPSRLRGGSATLVLALIAVLTAMDQGIAGLLIDPMKHELRLTDVQIGLANATTFSLAYGLLATPMGMLVDRLSRVRLLLGALVLWCGAMLLAALSQGLTLLVVSKIVLGLACAVTYPAAMSLIADYVPPGGRAMATGSYGTGQCVGQAGAIFIGGVAYGALTHKAAVGHSALFGLTPWREIYLGFALASFLVIPLLATLREPGRKEVRQHGGGTLPELWAYRSFLAPLLAGVLFLVGAASIVLMWSAPALMRIYGEQPGAFAGWFSAVSLGAGAVGLLSGGWFAELARRRGGVGIVMLPAVIGAALCVIGAFLAMTPNVFWFGCAAALFNLSYGVSATVAVVAINFRVPNELRGMTMGLSVVTMAVASATFPTLVAVVGKGLGDRLGEAMAAVAAPCALVAAVCFWMATARPRE